MSQKNRRRYQRKLDVGSLVSLLILGAICAGAACGFVRVKNAHVEHFDAKRSLEQEIRILEKELDSVSTRISTAFDRVTLATALAEHGSALVSIETSETLSGMPTDQPIGLAVAAPTDGDFTYINIDDPSG